MYSLIRGILNISFILSSFPLFLSASERWRLCVLSGTLGICRDEMKKILIWMTLTVCGFAEFVHVNNFFRCGHNYGPCLPEAYPEGRNPYKEAARKCPLMRQRAHGYLQIRPGVHLFYQLYYANGTKAGATEKPLLIWIQGGPGFAASGIGNFAEIGPLDMDFQQRNHTWVKKRNVLLIDHPVGAGFSYAEEDSLMVKSDREAGNVMIAIDLSMAIKLFLRRRSEFRKTPTYIIGQSYGGKITPRLATYLYTAIQKKELEMNFKGIAIGGGWVNPKESALTQPDFLYHTGTIDRKLYITAKSISLKLAKAINKKAYAEGAILDDLLFQTINHPRFINFNNVNGASPYVALEYLNSKMNLFVKPTLRHVNKTIRWRYLSTKVYSNLKGNFVVPTYSFLEKLMDTSDLKIVVYNGNLDIITPVAGASNWVHKLKWKGAARFANERRHEINGYKNGFYKSSGNFSFWCVFGAGHWVPEDNPEAMEHILSYLTSDHTELFGMIDFDFS